MALVNFDQSVISNATIRLLRGDVATELLSGGEVVTSFQKARWAVSFNVITLTKESRGAVVGAMTRLSSLANHFEISPPNYSGAVHTGSIVVTGGGQLGTSLIVGAAANTTILKAGEWFTTNGELKQVVEDCTSDSSGVATIEFEPALRASPPNSQIVNQKTPKIKLRLTNPEAAWAISQGGFTAVQFDCLEYLSG